MRDMNFQSTMLGPQGNETPSHGWDWRSELADLEAGLDRLAERLRMGEEARAS